MCELNFHEYLQKSIIIYHCNYKRKRRCIEDFLKQNNDSVDFLEYKKKKRQLHIILLWKYNR
jgi:hypothetical protein